MSSGINGPAGVTPSSSGVMSIIELLADGPRLLATYKEYEERTANLQKIVDLAGPASDIMSLRNQLQQQLVDVPVTKAKAQEEAESTISKARSQAEVILTNAELKARDIIDEANATSSTASSVMQSANLRVAEAEAKEAAFQDRVSSVSARELQLGADREQLAKDQAQLEADRKDLADRVARVQGILGQ